MKKILLISLLISLNALASFHAPKNFKYNNTTAVFVDFKEAVYELNYNVNTQKALVKTTITFESFEEGQPVFDSVNEPTSILLDGKNISQTLVKTPDQETSVRVLNEKVTIGIHTLVVENEFVESLRFTPNGVNSAFWFSDLDDRSFLEAYAVSNFEYDQVKMIFKISTNSNFEHKIYTNGKLTKLEKNAFQIEFPEYFTSSSLYYHLAPIGRYKEIIGDYKSIDGRIIPFIAYNSDDASMLVTVKEKALKVLAELENDYGAFPHDSVTIFNAGAGGMEYCGATMTELRALGHELTHSYFARGIMPANGNAGWIDESLASWRDKGYLSNSMMTGTSQMASHGEYRRLTDRMAYSHGANFMAYLNNKFSDKGGLKPFLFELRKNKIFNPLLTEEFIKLMNAFYGRDVTADFSRYAYGRNLVESTKKEIHPHHIKLKIKDFKKFL